MSAAFDLTASTVTTLYRLETLLADASGASAEHFKNYCSCLCRSSEIKLFCHSELTCISCKLQFLAVGQTSLPSSGMQNISANSVFKQSLNGAVVTDAFLPCGAGQQRAAGAGKQRDM